MQGLTVDRVLPCVVCRPKAARITILTGLGRELDWTTLETSVHLDEKLKKLVRTDLLTWKA